MFNEGNVHAFDLGAVAIAIAAVAGYLPAIASLLTVIWMLIRIWETDTVRGWVRAEQKAHEAKVIRSLEREVLATENVIEKAKEAVKPEVVAAVVEALPIDIELANAIKEKVLVNAKPLDDEMAPPK